MSAETMTAAFATPAAALTPEIAADVATWSAFAATDATTLATLDAHLATRATMCGHVLTAADASVYCASIAAIKTSSEALVHARRWAAFVSARGGASGDDAYALAASAVPRFEVAAPVEKKPSAPSTSGQEKKKKEDKPKVSTVNMDVSCLDIRVGRIETAWEHPEADKLWAEKISFGEFGERQICSGLRAFKTKEQMEGARVCVVVNVKPGKLRNMQSDGLVLCTSNADHTEVDFVIPPEGAAIGERIAFAGHEGEPEAVLAPKKKQLETVGEFLKTNADGVACYKDVPFMTSAGPCTSPLKDCFIK